jgi:hypothetical protein
MTARRGKPKHEFRIFGVDYEQAQVVTFAGDRYVVQNWYDALGKDAATPEYAAACVFQGPGGLWFAVDIHQVHHPENVQ